MAEGKTIVIVQTRQTGIEHIVTISTQTYNQNGVFLSSHIGSSPTITSNLEGVWSLSQIPSTDYLKQVFVSDESAMETTLSYTTNQRFKDAEFKLSHTANGANKIDVRVVVSGRPNRFTARSTEETGDAYIFSLQPLQEGNVYSGSYACNVTWQVDSYIDHVYNSGDIDTPFDPETDDYQTVKTFYVYRHLLEETGGAVEYYGTISASCMSFVEIRGKGDIVVRQIY